MKNIGITPCFLYPDLNRSVFGPKTLSYIEHDMVKYVVNNGAIPHLILNLPTEQLKSMIAKMDGIIFSGGSDVCPETYSAPYLDRIKWPGDLIRDRYEAKIFEICVQLKKPIFAICRGAQLINALLGGELYQDLNQQTQTTLQHRDAIKYDQIYHKIQFEPGGILEKIYMGEKQPHVNSVHHQGIKTLAPNLNCEAICPEDNLIEAYCAKQIQDHFILGVQWHPEFSPSLKGDVIDDSKLMQYFLKGLT